MIDCFFIGHNELEITKQRQLLRLQYGEDTHYYRETNVSYLGYIKYQNRLYSVSQIFNLFHQFKGDKAQSFGPLGIEETFNLAIAYLGSYLHRRGYTIDFINSFNKQKQELAAKLQQGIIRTVAIPTSFYISTYPVVEIINFIRKYGPTVKIIVGGTYIANQVRSLSEEELQRLFSSMGADIYVYSNEGEYALGELIKAIKTEQTVEQIDNIFYKHNDRYCFTKLSQEENCLDENPVDWGLFADRMTPFTNIRTSVSCPFSCTFCNFPRYAGKYRLAGLDNVAREIAVLNEMGTIKGMWIIDDTFNFPPERFKELLRLMIRNNNRIKWQSHLRCQYVDEEMVELMKASGCTHVILGIESGSQPILDNMNKKATVEQYRRGIALLNQYQIMSTALFIIGFPGETETTYQETFDFIETTRPTFYQARLWWCDPNTPIFKQKEKFQLEGSGYEWKHATMTSDQAHQLLLKMFKEIQNSIFETDFPIPFHLATRGISEARIKELFQAFNSCVREKLKRPYTEEETNPELIEAMRQILTRSGVAAQ